MSGGGLALPPSNETLRAEEEKALQGCDVSLTILLPDEEAKLAVKCSTEVGYVKLLLAQQHNIDCRKLKLFVRCDDGSQKLLIDPMSLCDYKEIKAPAATLIAQVDP